MQMQVSWLLWLQRVVRWVSAWRAGAEQRRAEGAQAERGGWKRKEQRRRHDEAPRERTQRRSAWRGEGRREAQR